MLFETIIKGIHFDFQQPQVSYLLAETLPTHTLHCWTNMKNSSRDHNRCFLRAGRSLIMVPDFQSLASWRKRKKRDG